MPFIACPFACPLVVAGVSCVSPFKFTPFFPRNDECGTTVLVEVVSIVSVEELDETEGTGEGVRAGEEKLEDAEEDREGEGIGGGVGIVRAAWISRSRRRSTPFFMRYHLNSVMKS